MDSGLCEIRVGAATPTPTLKDDGTMGAALYEPHVPAVLQGDEKSAYEPNFHR